MKTPLRISVLILALAAWGTFGYMTWRFGSQIRAIDARIAEQEEIIKEVEFGKVGLDVEANQVGDEVGALPDSVRSGKVGETIRSAFSMAKREVYYDGLIKRAEKRIHNATELRKEAKAQLVLWDVGAGAAGLTLLGLFVFLRRSR